MADSSATAEQRPAQRPRILYVVTEDWYFLSHRLPMARAARDAGFEVHVATNVSAGRQAIEAEGFTLHAVPFARGSFSPGSLIATIRALRRVHHDVRPDIVHHVALQPVVLGSLAAFALPAARVNAITGFGYSFASSTAKARIVRRVLIAAIRFLSFHANTVVLVQNDDDRTTLTELGIPASKIVMIPGSGVDVSEIMPLPAPTGVPTIAFVGRLLAYKGIRVLVAAQEMLRARGVSIELVIAGMPDPTNPDSVTNDEMKAWAAKPGITLLGHVRDIATVWARTHIAVLPSRHEGVPKSLLEAAAFGRPMIATDVPGCRDIVISGKTGLLVPLDDLPALAAAIEKLAASPELRAHYGAAARRLTVEKFSADAIGGQTAALYRSLIARPNSVPGVN